MNAEGFEVLDLHADVPYRPKGNFRGYRCFRHDGGCVLVAPSVLAELTDAARRAAPRETGGLLVGRFFRDGSGRYATVVALVEAPSGAGTEGRVTMSSDLVARLREQAAHREPSCDVIGWWHSHSVPSLYSQTDLRTQRSWTAPESVGILVFARPSPGSEHVVYQGPDSTVCEQQGVISGSPEPRPAGPEEPYRPPGSPRPPSGSAAGAPYPRRPAEPRTLAAHLGGGPVVIGLVALALLALLLFLVGRLGSIQHRLDSDVPSWSAAYAATWSCSPAQSWESETYFCTASVRSPGSIEWLEGKQVLGNGAQFTVQVPPGQTVTVTLAVADSTGQHDLGSQVLGDSGQATTSAYRATSVPRRGGDA